MLKTTTSGGGQVPDGDDADGATHRSGDGGAGDDGRVGSWQDDGSHAAFAGGTLTEPPRRRRGLGVVAGFTGAFVALVAAVIPLPYVIMSPGSAVNTLDKGLITVKGTTDYPTTGALDFTTVRVLGGPGQRPTAGEVLVAAVRSDQDVYPEEAFFPKGITAQQADEESAAEMTGSQQEAEYVALTALGKDIPVHPGIMAIPTGSPAKGHLAVGDRILTVAGQQTADITAVQRAVRAQKVGVKIPMTVIRAGKSISVTTPTMEREGRTSVGIVLGRAYSFPYDITIDAGDVGGPSAGMMFALAVYDRLTPGALTGGKRIAGTGTIDADGAVGPIGGIRQKIIGAREEGADYFLAPTQDCAELDGHVPDGITVVTVSTFDTARTAVEQIAAGKASSLPSCGR